MTVIKSRIIKIGNSQGLRIPKVLLEQLSLQGEVELEVQEDQLIVRPLQTPRREWAEQFRAMATHGDDQLLDDVPPSLSNWDDEEWDWS